MSQFLRQLHIVSSLKSSSDSDRIYPLCKNVSHMVSSSHFTHTKTLNKNLQLKTLDIESSPDERSGGKRQLAIILPWLMAKEKHVDKYRKLYLQRGFDVLTVRVTPQQMFFPVNGTQLVATNILDYLDANKQYEKVLVHGFSVGGYLMGEVFVKLQESRDKFRDVPDRIMGVIFDSAVDVEGTPTGIALSLAKNPFLVKTIQGCLKSHMALMYNVATKHYLKASKCFYDTPLKCPALLLVSEADKIGSAKSNMTVADKWRAKGVHVSFKCWNDSLHVGHMRLHEEEYISEIDKFLSKLKIAEGGEKQNLEAMRSSS